MFAIFMFMNVLKSKILFMNMKNLWWRFDFNSSSVNFIRKSLLL